MPLSKYRRKVIEALAEARKNLYKDGPAPSKELGVERFQAMGLLLEAATLLLIPDDGEGKAFLSKEGGAYMFRVWEEGKGRRSFVFPPARFSFLPFHSNASFETKKGLVRDRLSRLLEIVDRLES